MTNDEVTKRIEIALYSLNKTLENLENIPELKHTQNSSDIRCPICSLARDVLIVDIENIKKRQEYLVKQTKSNDLDNKLIAAIKAETFSEETSKRYGFVAAFLETAHRTISVQ